MTTRAEQSSPWLGFSPGAGGAGPSAPAQRFWASLGVLRPTLEWGTFLLMLSVVFTATWSVQSAGWTLTPPLMLATLIGYAAGAGLAKARISPWVLQSVGFTSGLLTIVTLLLVFLEGPGWFAGIHQIGYRIGAWAIAARSGGISTDALPFAVSLVAVTWFLGYVAGWFAFRRNNVWIAVALAGVGLLTNLSYLPSAFWSYFYLYLSLSMLTLAWAGILERRRVWEQDRINHPTGVAVWGMRDAAAFGLSALFVALLLPATFDRPPLFKQAYEVMRWPVEHFSGDFSRLFAGVEAKKAVPYRSFGDTLPFQGAIRLGDQVVFIAESTTPSYFRVRSYPSYLSQGWSSGPTEMVPVRWSYGEYPNDYYQERRAVIQQVTLHFSPSQLPIGGLVEEADRFLLAEVPQARVYTVNPQTLSMGAGTPADVRRVGYLLRDLANGAVLFHNDIIRVPDPTDAQFAMLLPEGFALADVTRDAVGVVTSVSFRRTSSPALEVLSVQSASRLLTSDSYIVRTSISSATAEQLRRAGTGYPGWVRDLYLQLPDGLPQRVRDLAAEVTAGAQTPYDKAVAIQSYLKTIPYSQNIPAPAYNADGVDHFLFVAQSGYSEYYGSAMAVMLRSVGVPARLAVGYTYGEVAPNGMALIRDRNAHGWTEVYFPGYGWVDFEPTPGKSLPGSGTGEGLGTGATGANLPPEEEFFDETDETFLPPVGLTGFQSPDQGGIPLDTKVRWWLAAVAATFAALFLLRTGTLWLLGTPKRSTQVYLKLTRLTALAGLGPRPGQTPREFSHGLGRRLAALEPAIATLTESYGRSTYGAKQTTAEEDLSVAQAWRRLRLPLLGQALGRVGRLRRDTNPPQ